MKIHKSKTNTIKSRMSRPQNQHITHTAITTIITIRTKSY